MAQLTAGGRDYPVRAILFDKDGTLMDFVYTWGYWGERVLAQFSQQLVASGLRALEPEVASVWGLRLNEVGGTADYDRNGPLSMGTMEEMLALLTWQGYERGLSWAEARVLASESRFYGDAQLEEARRVQAIPHIGFFLEQCRLSGIQLGVVTADESDAAEKHLGWLGIRSYFSVCIGNDQVERGKPYPDMVELACRELGVASSDVVVIGDTNGDMKMGRAAGAAVVIGITPEGREAEGRLSQADVVISSYLDLVIKGDGR